MKECTLLLKRVACLFALSAVLAGCGHGGTEIGNPTGPVGTTPTAGDTGGVGGDTPLFPTAEPATPSPTPHLLLLKDSQDGGDQPEDIQDDINREVPDQANDKEISFLNRWGLKGECGTLPLGFSPLGLAPSGRIGALLNNEEENS